MVDLVKAVECVQVGGVGDPVFVQIHLDCATDETRSSIVQGPYKVLVSDVFDEQIRDNGILMWQLRGLVGKIGLQEGQFLRGQDFALGYLIKVFLIDVQANDLGDVVRVGVLQAVSARHTHNHYGTFGAVLNLAGHNPVEGLQLHNRIEGHMPFVIR